MALRKPCARTGRSSIGSSSNPLKYERVPETRFIETADGREIYFHRNAVLDGAYRRLRVGSEVRFVERKGRTRSTVRLIGKHHLV